MIDRKRFLIATIALLLIAGSIGWRFMTVAKPMDSISQILENFLRPGAATGDDWAKVKLEKVPVKFEGEELSVWIGSSIKGCLEAGAGTNAPSIKVDTIRMPDGTVQTSIWKLYDRDKLTFNWGKMELETGSVGNIGGLEVSESPPGQQFNHISAIFGGTHLTTNDLVVLAYHDQKENRDKVFELPYQHAGYTLQGCYASLHDFIAVAPKMETQAGTLTSILIFDYRKGRILAEIPVPEGARNTRPHFSIDYTKKVLVAVGYDVDWLMTVDLTLFYKSNEGDLKRAE